MLTKTPAENSVDLRMGDFSTLSEALDYAATGQTGLNFYSGRGELIATLPYAELRMQAQSLARKLAGLGLPRGARVALVAETDPFFVRFFFACQYVGLVPVPLPAAVHLGGRQAMVEKLRDLLLSCGAQVAVALESFFPFLREASVGLDLSHVLEVDDFVALPEAVGLLEPTQPGETAYLQYTSGSTRFPRGVVVTQEAVMANLAGIIGPGLDVRPGDRCVSWLPFYHDMGLVGFLLAPLASQLSVDYLSTRDFAMRPRLWPSLISRNRGTISFSPTFGYALCTRRVRSADLQEYDLSSWRIAGIGAEPIRSDTLIQFSQVFASTGFDPRSFVASYGMAECSLAVSFAPLDQGLVIDRIDAHGVTDLGIALPAQQDSAEYKELVFCGAALPGHEIQIRDERGQALPDRHCGVLYVRGPSVMSGYLNNPEATREALSADGWLNTGDLAYLVDRQVIITGRQKDLIIINGRNIWPQDLEYLAPDLFGETLAGHLPGRLSAAEPERPGFTP
ncbi:MAG: fatty acyl-AMP ligase [Desulfuromonadaceae bacterium]